jgi:hypothetical protein
MLRRDMDETNTVALLNHDGRYEHGKERRWDKCVSCEVVRWLKEPCREYQGRVHSVDIVERFPAYEPAYGSVRRKL